MRPRRSGARVESWILNIRKSVAICIGLMGMVLGLAGVTAVRAASPQSASHDGQHDFDFNVGTWTTHIRLLSHPLSGSNVWTRLDGTVVVRPLLGGKAQVEEIEADGPRGHFEGMTLFLYDTHARQWSQYFAESGTGVLDSGVMGSFKGRRGEFYGQDALNGRSILVRMVWTVISPTEHHVEQAFSADGGKTWEPNFIADLAATRETPKVPRHFAAAAQHDFDWQLGHWTIHMRRMLHPLSAAESWTTYDGRVDAMKLWGGRANLVQINTKGPSGTLQFLALRLYRPQSHQWTLYFAHAGSDLVGRPMYGEFKNGRGEFYDVERLDGRSILGRFVFDRIEADSTRDEQAFSEDGGKTWEVNWTNILRRTTAQ
jgi:hypothetical protein